MERLEDIFKGQERELKTAKVLLQRLSYTIGSIDLARLIIAEATNLKPHDDDSMRRFSYGQVLQRLADYGYITDESGQRPKLFSVDTRVKIPVDAELFFREHYMEHPVEVL